MEKLKIRKQDDKLLKINFQKALDNPYFNELISFNVFSFTQLLKLAAEAKSS